MKFNFLASLPIILAILASACTEKPENPAGGTDTTVAAPELPADPQPGATTFAHRIMLVQHTGTYCPNCPKLMNSLKALSEDESYTAKYHHVAAHSYNDNGIGDPAHSQAAENLSQAFCSGYYPELTFNLTNESTGTSIAVETIKNKIDALHKEAASAGICAATKVSDGLLSVNIGVKAAEEGTYRIAAWLLEDGIRARQEGASADWQHTHNNAIRTMAGSTINKKIYGEQAGNIKAGEATSMTFTIELDRTWKTENCKVIILINALGADGRYNVVNCALCPVDGTIEYEYK